MIEYSSFSPDDQSPGVGIHLLRDALRHDHDAMLHFCTRIFEQYCYIFLRNDQFFSDEEKLALLYKLDLLYEALVQYTKVPPIDRTMSQQIRLSETKEDLIHFVDQLHLPLRRIVKRFCRN